MNDVKRWTNLFVAQGFTVESKFNSLVTLKEAREQGRKEATESPYLKYLGVKGVDITLKEFNKIRKEGWDYDALPKVIRIVDGAINEGGSRWIAPW